VRVLFDAIAIVLQATDKSQQVPQLSKSLGFICHEGLPNSLRQFSQRRRFVIVCLAKIADRAP